MLRSINSLPDDHNGHLRNLIERNARADVHAHGRLSAAVSDFSDIPSVYSHSYFSPRPSEISDSRVEYAYSSYVSQGRYEPHTSVLDLTDDRRSSYDDNADSTSEMTDESETTARMSYLGPKMRVHSRAPWEEEALEEVDEENFPGSYFSRRITTKSTASTYSSPRPSFAGSVGQQSEDSSQPATKRSFETTNSQVSLPHTRGGLYSLAQGSTSSNSLGRRTPVKESFLHKLSIGRLRSETPPATIVPNIPLTPSSMSSSANNLISTSASRQSSPDKLNSIGSPTSSYDSLEFLSARRASTHPYANPELIVSYPDASALPDTRHTTPHCDSETTVTPFPRGSKAKYNALARISIPDSSVNYVGSKVRTSPISTRNISSPVAAICSPQNLRPGGAERLPGWTERPSAAAFSLISLEEARAKRMRTSMDTGVATPSTSDFGTSFPANRFDHTISSSSSPLATPGSRARGRSISAGANAKNAHHNVLGQPKSDSDPVLREGFIPVPLSGKILKTKKSGFLRIFNRDRDLQSVPPVPSMPDGINQSQLSQRLAPGSIQRVPVPSLSSEVSISQNYGRSLRADIPTTDKNMKRSSPSLSINTTAQGFSARATTSSIHATLEVPSGEPQSAPPDLPEFPVLKLRPVSMLFSASFGDLVPSDLSEAAGQETPISCTPPSSRSPLSTPCDDLTSVFNDENHATAKALPEQMLSAKSTWQRHILELEGQVRDLKTELEQLKNNDEYCDKCGRGKNSPRDSAGEINKARTRSGTSPRTVYQRT